MDFEAMKSFVQNVKTYAKLFEKHHQDLLQTVELNRKKPKFLKSTLNFFLIFLSTNCSVNCSVLLNITKNKFLYLKLLIIVMV